MQQYNDILRTIRDNGYDKMDRTGVGCRTVTGLSMHFDDISTLIPVVSTKKTFFTGAVRELLWIISGSTNINDMPESIRHWWAPWAGEDGDIGAMYGQQLRAFGAGYVEEPIDQLQTLIDGLKNNPYSRRHVITLWNPLDLDKQNLTLCHGTVIQFHVEPTENGFDKLHCTTYQRSCDTFLGLPVNLIEYSVLSRMIAQVCGLTAGSYTHMLGDAHIYHNHFDQVEEALSRIPYDLPELQMNSDIDNIDDFGEEDLKLVNYQFHPSIQAEMAV